jgi:hypothetical protein
MDWNALGAIAESLGAIGVIGSVLYLAYEVRSNTKTMRAEAGTRAQMEWSKFNFAWSEHKDRDAMSKVFDPSKSLAEFSESDRIGLTFTLRSFAQQVEAQYFQYEAGILNEEVWDAHLMAFAALISFPAAAEWWEGETLMPIYTKSFLARVAKVGKVDISETVVIGINAKDAT